MNFQQQAQQFENSYKHVNDRFRVLETLLIQFNERADAEDRYSRFLEKTCQGMTGQGGDLDDLLQGVKVDLSQRSQYNKQFTSSFKNDIEHVQQQMKQLQLQYKTQSAEITKIDRDLKVHQDKLDKLKEKQTKVFRDYEEAALAVEAATWNKEAVVEQRSKCMGKLQSLAQLKAEVEGQVKVVVNYYNNTLVQYQNQLQNGLKWLQQIFSSLFALSKDLIMKTLVYEISRLRNLQYDSEQFFKEVEKYEEPFDFNVASEQHSQLGLLAAKEIFYKQSASVQCYMKEVADRVAYQYKFIEKKETPSDEQLMQNTQLQTDLKQIAMQLISKVYQRPEPQNQITFEQFYEKYNESVPQEQLQEFIQFEQNLIENPTIDYNKLNQQLEQRIFRKLYVIVIETYRSVSQCSLNDDDFKKYLACTKILLSFCSGEQDLSVLKRTILMLFTLYQNNNGDRNFLYQPLLTFPLWQNLDLWEGLIFISIEEEIDKSNNYQNREQLFKDKNVIFSNILSISLNMIQFKVSKQETRAMVQKFGKIFQLYDIQIQELVNFVESDGKVDVNKNINSLSILSSLYSGNEQPAKSSSQSQLGGVQQGYVHKKILMFDKKPMPPQQQQQQFNSVQNNSKKPSLIFTSTSFDRSQSVNMSDEQQQLEFHKSRVEQLQIEEPQQQQPEQKTKKVGFLKKLL